MISPTGKILVPHEPFKHKEHTDKVPCGCWSGEKVHISFTGLKTIISCSFCGASYKLWDVIEFRTWLCYDCRGSYGIRTIRL